MMGFGSFWGQTGWPCSKHGSQRQKLLRSSWNWNLPKPNLSYSGIPVCKICRTGLTLGSSNFIWWHASECPEDPARSNWKAAFISLIELQILWLEWSQIAESTDTWLWQSAPCQVAYPIVSVATKELSESVLLAVSIGQKGILLLSQWHCIRALHSHRRPFIQYNVGQTWGLLTAPPSEFANVCSWFICLHFT